jgi:hypothetical protein
MADFANKNGVQLYSPSLYSINTNRPQEVSKDVQSEIAKAIAERARVKLLKSEFQGDDLKFYIKKGFSLSEALKHSQAKMDALKNKFNK